MSVDRRRLVDKLVRGEISDDHFVEDYLKGRMPNEATCGDLLRNAIAAKDADLVEEALLVGYIAECITGNSAPLLCDLLRADWHRKHEDIAKTLAELREPSTVDCLYDAAHLRLAYLDYDETFQLARKAIKGLSAIGTPNAIDRIKSLAEDPNPVISGYAIKELKYKGLV